MEASKKRLVKKILVAVTALCMVIAMVPMAGIDAVAENLVEITSAEVSGIVMPAAGEAPSFSGTIPEGAHYRFATEEELEGLGFDNPGYINGMWWYDNDGEMSETDIFEADTTYWFETVLVPEEGYKFSDQVVCSINGDEELVDLEYTQINEGYILVSSNDLAFEYKEIETVEVSEIDMPVVGENPDFNGTIPEGANYHFATKDELDECGYGFSNKNINGIWWVNNNLYLSSTTKFEKGKNYSLAVVLMPNEGYIFSEDVQCKLNGGSTLIGEVITSESDLYFDVSDLFAEYKITFDANGGTCDTEFATTQNYKITDYPTPQREGYDFEGWFTEDIDGEKVNQDTVFGKNTTLFAHWTEAETESKEITRVEISGMTPPVVGESPDFDGVLPEGANYHFATKEELEAIGYPRIDENINGIWWVGNTGNMSPDDTFEAGKEYYFRAAIFPNDGYTFAETVECTINGRAELNDSDYTTSWGTDFEVYSATFPTEYRVTFNPCGGSCDVESAITEGGKLTTLPTPQREGYAFDGWFESDEEESDIVTTETIFTESATVYAGWTSSHIHRVSKVEPKEPTCTEAGNKEYYTCDCGKWFEDIACTKEIEDHLAVEIPALGHDFSEKWSNDSNNHWRECVGCGEKKDHAAHTFGAWNVTTPPTETEKGQKERLCTVCGYREIAAIDPTKTGEPKDPVIPPTGDETDQLPWMTLFISLVGAAGLTITVRKRKAQ